MKYKIIIFFILLYNIAYSRDIKISVIDSGINDISNTKLCSPPINLTNQDIKDYKNHGDKIIKLITKYAGNKGYCFYIIKYYENDYTSYKNLFKALEISLKLNVDVIIYAGGGNKSIELEKKIIKKLLNNNVTIITAAGNNFTNLDVICDYYPACYDKRIIVIGCEFKGQICNFSNYGDVVDYYFNGIGDDGFIGTSRSTAVFSGKFIKKAVELIDKTTYK